MEERYIKAIDPYKWVRPAGWLTMPTITSANNKLAFLMAVYENKENCFTVSNATSSINATADWGDGTSTTINSTAIREKRYSYSAISSIVLQDANGVNYKQVIITITYNSGTIALWNIGALSATIGAAGNRAGTSQLLEAIISWDGLVNISSSRLSNPLLQSLIIKKMVVNAAAGSYFQNLPSLRNFEGFENITTSSSTGAATSIFNALGPINPININWNSNTVGIVTAFSNGQFRKLGTVNIQGTGSLGSMFTQCYNLEEVGDINLNTMTISSAMFQFCYNLRKIGTITNTNLTNITNMFNNCFNLKEIVFSNASTITTTSASFTGCPSLQTLRLPGISVSFSILNANLDRTALVNLLNDLGTVVGQTITLTGNPGLITLTAGEIAIATGKGWTVTV